MGRYIRKAKEVRAERWWEIEPYEESQNRVVDYFRSPSPYESGQTVCTDCGNILHVHGWINAPNSSGRVCPGDWVVCEDGIYTRVRNVDFVKEYEPVK